MNIDSSVLTITEGYMAMSYLLLNFIFVLLVPVHVAVEIIHHVSCVLSNVRCDCPILGL